MDEQLQLIEYSKKIDVEYNNAISIVSIELDKINEFRQSLIVNAVTGKLKVWGNFMVSQTNEQSLENCVEIFL